MSNENDWKRGLNWKFPYKGLNDPDYIKARNRLFKGNHGWWWGDGWWNGDNLSSAEKQRIYKRNKK